jgi:hypothetical protein
MNQCKLCDIGKQMMVMNSKILISPPLAKSNTTFTILKKSIVKTNLAMLLLVSFIRK